MVNWVNESSLLLHRTIQNENHGFSPHCILCDKMHLVFMGQQLGVWAMMQLNPALLNCWVSPMISGGQKHTLGLSFGNWSWCKLVTRTGYYDEGLLAVQMLSVAR